MKPRNRVSTSNEAKKFEDDLTLFPAITLASKLIIDCEEKIACGEKRRTCMWIEAYLIACGEKDVYIPQERQNEYFMIISCGVIILHHEGFKEIPSEINCNSRRF